MQANVCIPTVGESELLPHLIATLQADETVRRIDLFVNEPERMVDVLDQLASLERVHTNTAPERALYPSWNTAIRRARREGVKLAILNDDIALPFEKPIFKALKIWQGCGADVAVLGFDHTDTVKSGIHLCRGSYRHHGVPGFAFMVDPEKVREVDERFQWWGGDDDLFFQAEADGHKLGRCYVRVQHSAESTASKRPWTHEVRGEDRALMQEKWGDAW